MSTDHVDISISDESFQQADNASDYGDFGDDSEELTIADQLLSQIETAQDQQDTLHTVTDIEDYEAPRGIRLPKVLGFESKRQWSVEPEGTTQVLCDVETGGELDASRLRNITDILTSD